MTENDEQSERLARKPGCIYKHPHPDHECRNQDDMAASDEEMEKAMRYDPSTMRDEDGPWGGGFARNH